MELQKQRLVGTLKCVRLTSSVLDYKGSHPRIRKANELQISDSPPPPVYAADYPASQVKWVNKTRFLNLPSKDAFTTEYEMQGHRMKDYQEQKTL